MNGGASKPTSSRDLSPDVAPGGTGEESSVLFLCNHNTIRSPMAEALTRSLHPRRLYTASAGLQEGWIDPFVVAVLAEQGIDAGDHEPQLLDHIDDEAFDVIVTLTPSAHHRALELTRTAAVAVEYWPVPDPTATQGSREQRIAAYREARDYIRARITERFGAR